MDPVTNTYLTRHFGDEVGVLLAEMTRESVRFSSLESAVDYWDVKSRFSLRGGIRLIEPASSRIALSTGKQYILVPHHILTPEMIDAFATLGWQAIAPLQCATPSTSILRGNL